MIYPSYFKLQMRWQGGGDVTAGPGGDIDKLDVRQITHLNYSFGLIYNAASKGKSFIGVPL
jgi:hypothetical protein